ncbi:MAG: exonuclease subunit SbcD [Crocosphaera sp.]|nr:exonuclease subunit SbcD [Crocosphaera sp.]
MIKVLHFSDIHLGSGFSHGTINPKTGLNTRLEDFITSLSLCIDRAIDEAVDLVLFGGDAFPDATPPPYIQEAFATQFRRLADASIPTILLVGNHDQHSQGNGGASLSIYRTLAVPGFIVGDNLVTHKISTKSGEVQVITLPWLTKSSLLTKSKTEGLSLSEVNQLLIEALEPVLESEIRQLDKNMPTVLLGHLMVNRARFGAEQFLAVGRGFTIPISLLIRPELDYVALGHVHKHQNLNPNNQPPIVYPGSIERVDFSEEKEEKGYILINLKKGEAVWEFCPLPARPFVTIKVDISQAENPQKSLIKAINKKMIEGAVIRVNYQIRSEQLELIDNRVINDALTLAHSYTIRPEIISQLSRPRLPELGIGKSLDPREALKTYLDNKEDIQDIVNDMLEAAELLLQEQ